MKIIYTDVLVIGGGLAGCASASAPNGAATT
jgi:succinate dehydrogenase/fumarate reductase flavoprotein subunit